jgi:hypothetical protein
MNSREKKKHDVHIKRLGLGVSSEAAWAHRLATMMQSDNQGNGID